MSVSICRQTVRDVHELFDWVASTDRGWPAITPGLAETLRQPKQPWDPASPIVIPPGRTPSTRARELVKRVIRRTVLHHLAPQVAVNADVERALGHVHSKLGALADWIGQLGPQLARQRLDLDRLAARVDALEAQSGGLAEGR